MNAETEYVALVTSRETLAADIARAGAIVAAHACADPRTVQWRCDPLPGILGAQLVASWPCRGAR